MESFLVGNPACPECRPLKSLCNDVQELFANADKWRPPEAKNMYYIKSWSVVLDTSFAAFKHWKHLSPRKYTGQKVDRSS